MNKHLYLKLAANNIKKNSKIYVPYILSCIGTIMMFYIMCFITTNKALDKMPGSQALITILWMGTVVIGLFSLLILCYTNSFLIKRRKKEFGLFNILGMEKKHLAKVIAAENVYVTAISLFFGLLSGILFSKLMLMLLSKLMSFAVPFKFSISLISIVITVILFLVIFTLTLLNNLVKIHLSKPIELLKGGNVGEKEPKTKWLLALIGFVTLGGGYAIANFTESPLDALGLFFVAVILVIIGTYCLFTAGSISVLKLLRKNKNYYYKTKHFTSVSGMIYRMKQNAVGLGNICILSTMVLVMLSTTVSLNIGFEDALRNLHPRNIEISTYKITDDDCQALKKKIDTDIGKSGVDIENKIEYRYHQMTFVQTGSSFGSDNPNNSAISRVYFIPLSEYNNLENTSATLGENEVLVYAASEYDYDIATFNGVKFNIKSKINTLNVEKNYLQNYTDTYYIIVPDEKAIADINMAVSSDESEFEGLSYYLGFDVKGSREDQVKLNKILYGDLKPENSSEIGYLTSVDVRCAESARSDFLSVYGGLLFLGIFLGALFIMATALIMYYKQISEGYDDKERFDIMMKVGMSHDEIKKTIRSQVLTVFFLPLAAACIHIAAAFRMITKLLLVMNLQNVSLFAICTVVTILVFGLIYAVVYALTAKAYYKIIS